VPWLLALGVPLAAFAGALAAVLAVVLLARQGPRASVVGLILAGVVVGSSLSAATSFVMLQGREQAAGVLAWLLGSFAFASWRDVLLVAPLVFVTLLLMLGSSRALNLLQLGEAEAEHLGLPVERFKLFLIAAASLATAASVGVAGVIGFVGLIVPHAVRLALGPDYRRLVPASALLGASFLVLADVLSRSLLPGGELPVGIVTALVGGPFFLYLLRRRLP
jgi:iron complex transport system permease protein